MDSSIAEQLSAEQSAAGAFVSYIDRQGQLEPDYNGFTTALVLRSLRTLPEVRGLERIRCRALDYLEGCGSRHIPGAFGFWPPDQRPVWAQKVPEDIDDTVVITLELAIHGRLIVKQVQKMVYEVLMPALLTEVNPLGPPWIRPLVFPTWLGGEGHRSNPVDCCVNANTVALLRWCGLTQLPGYVEGNAMITAALEWAVKGSAKLRLARLATLTPYYPNPFEFLQAIRHAISCGAVELQSARGSLSALLVGIPLPSRMHGLLCSRAYCGPYWRCPALNLVRELVNSQEG